MLEEKSQFALSLKPTENEYNPFFAGYVSLVPEVDVLAVLNSQSAEVARYAGAVSAAGENLRYAPGKWTIREVFNHLVDAERVFGYRAFCISRGDQTPLPGFDENDYVANSDSAQRGLADIVREFMVVRDANLAFLQRLGSAQWQLSGVANGSAVSVQALAFIMAGHVRHHFGILRLRYGVHAKSDPGEEAP
jgi:hypothetical protein